MSYNPADNNLLHREQMGRDYGSVNPKLDVEVPASYNDSEEDGFCAKIWTKWNIAFFVGTMVILLIMMILMISFK